MYVCLLVVTYEAVVGCVSSCCFCWFLLLLSGYAAVGFTSLLVLLPLIFVPLSSSVAGLMSCCLGSSVYLFLFLFICSGVV